MKEYRSPTGERRLWFDQEEIEWMMEDQLRNAGLLPSISYPAIDLEELLEGHLRVKLDLHARLDVDVLGMTQFRSGKRPLVSINKDLTSRAEMEEAAGGSLGRWRATLAHEAAHVVLHRVLFDVPPEQGSFFEVKGLERLMLRCLMRDVSFTRGNYDWKEVQANRGMAALLMPSRIFRNSVRNIAKATTVNDLAAEIPVSDSHEFSGFLLDLSRRWEVSQEAARIRLETLGLLRISSEPMLEPKYDGSVEHLNTTERGGRRSAV